MRVDVAQIDISLGDKEKNLGKAVSVIKESDADLILFPEVFTTGFDYENLGELGEGLEGETLNRLMEAGEGRIIAGGMVEKSGGKIYNSFVLVENKELMGCYRKIHLFQREKNIFSRGKETVVSDTTHGRIGLSTCYDLRFPELYRDLMNKGTEICLLCANFPEGRKEHWINLIKARAIENQFFMIACNRVGEDNFNKYAGNSLIISPWGEVLAEAGGKEEVLSCVIDLGDVARVREKFPVLKDIQLGKNL